MNDSHTPLRPRWSGRAILHVDLDAFFASVEQLDNPEWRGRPVIVGGHPDKRGVVSTCSYEARVFGVRSAMPSSRAKALCPHAVWTSGNFKRYREMSNTVMEILGQASPTVQQTSIDEAFLDVTPGRVDSTHPVDAALMIKERIRLLGITCSIGLSTNKTVSKIGSDAHKPDGLTVVWPGDERAFLDPLPIESLSGIGPVTAEKLRSVGIETVGYLTRSDLSTIKPILGSRTSELMARALGDDDSIVSGCRPVKSVSNERSYATDLVEAAEILAALDLMSAKVARRLRDKGLAGRTVGIKLKTSDFAVSTPRKSLDHAVDDESEIIPVARELFRTHWVPGTGLRLVGVAVSGFAERELQLSLFESEDAPGSVDDERSPRDRRALSLELDAIRKRFGENAVVLGKSLRFVNRDTETAPMNKDAD